METQNLIAIIVREYKLPKRILEKLDCKWNYDREYFGLAAAYYKLELLDYK